VGPGLEKLANPCDFLPRNEKRPAVDLSMPSVNSFGRQSSNSDESSPGATLFVTILSAIKIHKAFIANDLRSSRPVWSVYLRRDSNCGLTQPAEEILVTTRQPFTKLDKCPSSLALKDLVQVRGTRDGSCYLVQLLPATFNPRSYLALCSTANRDETPLIAFYEYLFPVK